MKGLERDMQIAVPTRHPLGDRVLLRLPETIPTLAVVAAVGGYRPLQVVTLERRVVLRNGNSYYNRCAEFHLTAPVATLRGSFLSMFLPNRTVGLVALRDSLVTSDPFLSTATACPGAPRLVTVPRRELGERQLVGTEDLATGTYCFIPLPRMPPEQPAMQEGICFRWEQVPGTTGNPVMTDPLRPNGDVAIGQTAEDHEQDTAAQAAEAAAANCEERNGMIPCTERCYRANGRWPDPASPADFFESERLGRFCSGP